MALEYNFFGNNYTTIEPIKEPYVSVPNLLGDSDVFPGAYRLTRDGIPIIERRQESTISLPEYKEEELKIPLSSVETELPSSLSSVEYSKASKDVMDRAVKAAKYLVNNGNFTKEQASAIVGVMIDENKVDPASYMKAEKAGKGVKGTGGFGYGAGIGSWTFENTKNKLLELGGYKPYTPIESLSLEEQLRLFVIDSNSRMKRYYDALKRCNNLEDASATAVLITGGVGKSKNWDTHPTTAEAKALSDWYGRSNDARFGKSKYHWDLDKRRLDYAKQVLEKLEKEGV